MQQKTSKATQTSLPFGNDEIITRGSKFGKLTVLQEAGLINENGKSITLWECKCKCGNIINVREDHLYNGKQVSCGCDFVAMKRSRKRGTYKKDMTGQQFGSFKVLKEKGRTNGNREILWECECQLCKNKKLIRGSTLRNRKTKIKCDCQDNEVDKKIIPEITQPQNPHDIKSYSSNAIDITGQQFGKLTALRPIGRQKNNGIIIWQCKCECGTVVHSPGNELRGGKRFSCGCENPTSYYNRKAKPYEKKTEPGTIKYARHLPEMESENPDTDVNEKQLDLLRKYQEIQYQINTLQNMLNDLFNYIR